MDDLYDTEIVKTLNKKIKDCNILIEGNCMYDNNSDFKTRCVPDLRQNLFNIAKQGKTLLEIGFNGGHSNYVFLKSNPNLQITNFDINMHSYTEPCFNYLNTKFKQIKLVKGDSLKTIPKHKHEIFDIIHIDGGHGNKYAFNDIFNCKRLSNENTIVILDDTDFDNINNIMNDLLSCDFIKQIDYKKYNLVETRPHRFFQYVFH